MSARKPRPVHVARFCRSCKIELKVTPTISETERCGFQTLRFEVVEPKELMHVTVTAYHRGAPKVGGKFLKVGDHVRFELPSAAQRRGILLSDLKGLRLRE